MNYIIDTNIIKAIIDKNQKIIDKIGEELAKGNDIFINGISYYEIKRSLLYLNAYRQLTDFESICRLCGSLLLDKIEIFDESSNIWADLRIRGNEIGDDADILIAGTAKINNCVVITDNEKHYSRIQGLSFENWLNN